MQHWMARGTKRCSSCYRGLEAIVDEHLRMQESECGSMIEVEKNLSWNDNDDDDEDDRSIAIVQ